jgi:hypothetical protein
MPQSLTGQSEQSASFASAWAHYTGQISGPLIKRPGEPDDNIVLGLGRLVVDKGAAFLFGEGVTSQIMGNQPEPKQDWLDECWRRNKRTITLLKLATNGGIFGHAFLRLLDGDPYPRVIVLDPQIVEVVTDPDDIDTVWKFIISPRPIHTEADDPELPRRTVIMNPSGKAGQPVRASGPWEIHDQQMRTGGAWSTVVQATWPYPFCPVVHCQNLPKPNEFWGESDLPRDVLHILDAITTVASHYNKIIRLHAHPKVWARGMGNRTIDVAIDSVIMLPGETGELQSLEMQSDLSSTMALLDKLISLLSYMVRIPLVAMGEPDGLGAISGVALQIRYQPLIEKTNAKRLTYGDVLVETDRCLLAMAGRLNFGDTTITNLSWPELLPSDPVAERQALVLDDSLGIISRETLSEKLGYSWTDEQQKLANEKQDDIALGLTAPPVPALAPDGEVVPPPATILAPLPATAKS